MLKYRRCLRSIIIAFAAMFILVASPLLVFGNPQWSRFIFIFQSNVFPERDGLWSPPPNSRFTGKWLVWYNNGQLHNEISYIKGQRHGACRVYSPAGKLMAAGKYFDGIRWCGTFNDIDYDFFFKMDLLYDESEFFMYVTEEKEGRINGKCEGWLLTKENRLQLGFRAIAKNGHLIKVIEKYTIDGIPYTIDENGNVVYLDKPKEEIIPQRSRIIR